MEKDAEEQLAPSKLWLQRITDAQKGLQTYQDKCDNIDKKYADLEGLAGVQGDREFQIFWANLEVLKPIIYERAPRPVVMPRHSDSGELERVASEILERVLEMDIEADDMHEKMVLVRDDLALNARGVPWVLDNGSVIHVDRRDFIHELSRKWIETGWVARRAYMNLDEGLKRFGDVFKSAKREEIEPEDGKDYKTTEKKAQVWEIWSKTDGAVYWVTEGVDTLLDSKPPLIDVKGFFPCPKPAYATLERGTLKPVPDFVYYRDQVDEINELTARIHSLSESLRLKGFYASGATEVGEAIETAMKSTDNKSILVPVSNFAALGGVALKDAIIWLPVREVAEVITNLVALRRQLIEDVYEITGLSDIMRGTSEASETLGAQQLKAQFGNVRVRGRQGEMVRVSRDVLRIKGEIFAETLEPQELLEMSGKKVPTNTDLARQIVEFRRMAAQAMKAGQQPPQEPDWQSVVTIERVSEFLRNDRMRSFLLEIESDSTIAADEQAEKQSRIEFVGAVGSFIQQAGAMVAQQPETAPFAAEMLKFAAGGFRAGRDLGQAIDEFAEMVKSRASQSGGPSPEQVAAAEAAQRESAMKLKKLEADIAREERKGALEEARLELDVMTKAQEAGMRVEDAERARTQQKLDAFFRAQELSIEKDQRRPAAI